MKLTVVDHAGEPHEISVEPGDILMHVLRDKVNYEIGICGGEMSCGTCLVRLSAEWRERIVVAGEEETEMLEALDAGEDSRLACQIVVDAAAAGMQATILHED
jgi:2Fe-2S ferredoxin